MTARPPRSRRADWSSSPASSRLAHARTGTGPPPRRILGSLIDGYSTVDATRSPTRCILHGVYDKPKGIGVDEGTLWGDYFYLEALARATHRDWTSHW